MTHILPPSDGPLKNLRPWRQHLLLVLSIVNNVVAALRHLSI